MKFIEPNRSNYVVSAKEPDDDGVLDIGVAKGTFCDGRPYRLECWCMDELYMATVFFDDALMTAWNRFDMVLMLELEELVKFSGRPLVQAHRVKDDGGRDVWSVNLVLKDARGQHAEILRPIQKYR